MSYGFRGLREPKMRRVDEAQGLKTGSKESDPVVDTYSEDIDPADFFDPEEFGIRRRDPKSSGP